MATRTSLCECFARNRRFVLNCLSWIIYIPDFGNASAIIMSHTQKKRKSLSKRTWPSSAENQMHWTWAWHTAWLGVLMLHLAAITADRVTTYRLYIWLLSRLATIISDSHHSWQLLNLAAIKDGSRHSWKLSQLEVITADSRYSRKPSQLTPSQLAAIIADHHNSWQP